MNKHNDIHLDYKWTIEKINRDIGHSNNMNINRCTNEHNNSES